jgi:hypothetical protein
VKTAPIFPIPTSSPPKLIPKIAFCLPFGLASMSSIPTSSTFEDLEAALSQFATIAADLKKQASLGSREYGSLSI